MEILLASDHAGFECKNNIYLWLLNNKKIDLGFKASLYEKTLHNMYNVNNKFSDFTVRDLGCKGTNSVDYPDFANKVCAEMLGNVQHIGILVCGTGIGMCMAANKFYHIRAALCHNVHTASMTRKHNNANVLCLGARTLESDQIIPIVETFLTTRFEEGRHHQRIDKFSR
jgi:ribose 5-phosphate isomerase B|tara:strand:- start:7122 stop:7631 length:510 start_codon:yes stop_codon:yes gene_type:complete